VTDGTVGANETRIGDKFSYLRLAETIDFWSENFSLALCFLGRCRTRMFAGLGMSTASHRNHLVHLMRDSVYGRHARILLKMGKPGQEKMDAHCVRGGNRCEQGWYYMPMKNHKVKNFTHSFLEIFNNSIGRKQLDADQFSSRSPGLIHEKR